jgi:hypothetical protein
MFRTTGVVVLLTVVGCSVAISPRESHAQEPKAQPSKKLMDPPEIRTYPMIQEGASKSQPLGPHTWCGLAAAGERTGSKPCRCVVDFDKGAWQLRLETDNSIPGMCNCQARCID